MATFEDISNTKFFLIEQEKEDKSVGIIKLEFNAGSSLHIPLSLVRHMHIIMSWLTNINRAIFH